MERGSELLIALVVILMAALDLLVRWLKGKMQHDQPAGAAGVEEADTELLERPPAKPQLPPAAPPPPPSQPPGSPPTARPRRPRPARRWLNDPIDARRGIVLMTILGPCRGLQAPDE